MIQTDQTRTHQPDTDSGQTDLSTQQDRIGLAVLAVLFLGGIWLMTAPFIVGYQGQHGWETGTINAFAVGGSISLITLATIVAYITGTLRELVRRTR